MCHGHIDNGIMSDNFESVCKSVVASLGYSTLKNEQYAVIKSFVLGSDVFGVLPTGYGKILDTMSLLSPSSNLVALSYFEKHCRHIRPTLVRVSTFKLSVAVSVSVPRRLISSSINLFHTGITCCVNFVLNKRFPLLFLISAPHPKHRNVETAILSYHKKCTIDYLKL